jgi:hypothetical protein
MNPLVILFPAILIIGIYAILASVLVVLTEN